MKLTDKVVVLTGAASGIGRSTALLFAQEGAVQFLVDIDEAGLRETLEQVSVGKERTHLLKADVSKESEIREAIHSVIQKENRLDVLVCNAGVVRVGLIEDFPDEDYDLLINVNVKGTQFTCKHAVPQLKEQRAGSIITFASVAAHVGQAQHAHYCSTKAAILGFTRALALDLAPFGVRVNSISPGATDTPMLRSDVARQAKTRGIGEELVRQEFEAEGVWRRWATPREIAMGVLFLASDDSSYMTGADLRLDGGWTAR
jgi:NAD(P)-dependent dehydrogenase (short-subunit alcohol dehydrogenase family)